MADRMHASVRNRLMALGVVWGLVLAALPFFVMADGRLSGFAAAAVAGSVVSGALGTVAAGKKRLNSKGRSVVRAMVGAGLWQGLVGGAAGALCMWAVMSVAISGISVGDLASLMRPQVFLGSFFVALSAFAYALVGGLVLSPIFGTLINRLVRGAKEERVAG